MNPEMFCLKALINHFKHIQLDNNVAIIKNVSGISEAVEAAILISRC
jgi:hypothetical protein